MIQLFPFLLCSFVFFEIVSSSLCILYGTAFFDQSKEIFEHILAFNYVESLDIAPFDKFSHHLDYFCLDGDFVFFEHFLQAIEDIVAGKDLS